MAKKTKQTTKTKDSENSAMWTLFNKIFDWVMSWPWRKFWLWIVDIPKVMKYLLFITIFAGICYLAYTKLYTTSNIKDVQEQVNTLNQRIENMLLANDYEVDMEYMILTLYLLEELNEQQYQISRTNTIALIRHMKHMDPAEPLIVELESSLDRLEQQHIALKRHFRLGIKKFNPSGKLPDELQDDENFK